MHNLIRGCSLPSLRVTMVAGQYRAKRMWLQRSQKSIHLRRTVQTPCAYNSKECRSPVAMLGTCLGSFLQGGSDVQTCILGAFKEVDDKIC